MLFCKPGMDKANEYVDHVNVFIYMQYEVVCECVFLCVRAHIPKVT